MLTEKQKEYQRNRYKNNLEKERARAIKKNNALRTRNQTYVLDYLKTHPCVDCGIDDPVVLEFDHVRGEKVNAIAELISRRSIEVIQEEINKCEVRCANCHRRKTAKDRGYFRLDKEN